jgi:hypothetical protein
LQVAADRAGESTPATPVTAGKSSARSVAAIGSVDNAPRPRLRISELGVEEVLDVSGRRGLPHAVGVMQDGFR